MTLNDRVTTYAFLELAM